MNACEMYKKWLADFADDAAALEEDAELPHAASERIMAKAIASARAFLNLIISFFLLFVNEFYLHVNYCWYNG